MNKTTGKIGRTGYTLVAVVALGLTLLTSQSIAQGIGGAMLIVALVWLSDIDIATRRLPNKIVGALALIGAIGVTLSHWAWSAGAFAWMTVPVGPILISPAVDAALGVALAALPSLGIAGIYRLVRGRSGFGAGDVKLLAALGIYLGLYTALVLPLAAVLSLIVLGVGAIVRPGTVRLSTTFPFGPFIATAATVLILWGGPVWSWCIGWLLP